MDWTYTFGDPSTLYLNVTNRCTNRCVFCVRNFGDRLGSGVLRVGAEPSLDELIDEVEPELDDIEELVWCGFGEPTFRPDLITGIAPTLHAFRARGGKVRLNTNGHGNAIKGRNICPELGEAIDIVSISLNAPTAERYVELCDPRPSAVGLIHPEELFVATTSFLAEAPRWIAEVRASVVAHVLDAEEIKACEDLADELAGVELTLR